MCWEKKYADVRGPRYHDYSARTAPYLVWPDARLRAYLREHNMSEDALPTSRPTLLRTSHHLCPAYLCVDVLTPLILTEEVRIRWVQTQNRTESLFTKIRDIILSSVGTAEAKLATILDIITGHAESAKTRTSEKYEEGKGYANEKAAQAGEKKGEYESAGKKYWNEKVEEAQKGAGKAKVEL